MERAYLQWVRRFIRFHHKRRPREMREAEIRAFILDFTYGQVMVRDGMGEKDRVTMLPAKLKQPLSLHLQRVKVIHEQDLAAGYGEVFLPYALE